ncbi:hypothetical protein KM043_004092 [Ampulex compressa]|nr:hypothetical protein KM043_004092 [Ampulex compressa]
MSPPATQLPPAVDRRSTNSTAESRILGVSLEKRDNGDVSCEISSGNGRVAPPRFFTLGGFDRCQSSLLVGLIRPGPGAYRRAQRSDSFLVIFLRIDDHPDDSFCRGKPAEMVTRRNREERAPSATSRRTRGKI